VVGIEVQDVGHPEDDVVTGRAEPRANGVERGRGQVDGGQVTVATLDEMIDQSGPSGADIDDGISLFDLGLLDQAEREPGNRLPPGDPVDVLRVVDTLPEVRARGRVSGTRQCGHGNTLRPRDGGRASSSLIRKIFRRLG
jgi:hypothetical protein